MSEEEEKKGKNMSENIRSSEKVSEKEEKLKKITSSKMENYHIP